MSKRIALAIVLACASGCSSSSEPTGESGEAVDSICNQKAAASLDGIPAYPYCGNTNVWSNNGIDTRNTSGGTGWIQTEYGYGYQCVEYAVRYFHFKWGVSTAWGVPYAKDMCATHPSSVSVTTSPVHGDLIIFNGGSCGADPTAGHVAAIDKVTSTSVDVVQENSAGTGTFKKSCAACFLHAKSNVPPPQDAGSDAHADAASDAAVTHDAATDAAPEPDAAPPKNDAAIESDAGTEPSTGGCSTSPSPAGAWWMVLALGALVRRRVSRPS